MQLSLEHLQKLSTKNLLALFKVERGRLRGVEGRCDCCGPTDWELYPNSTHAQKAKAEYEEYEKYVGTIKQILSTREHVERKTEPHVNHNTKDWSLKWGKYVTNKVSKRKR